MPDNYLKIAIIPIFLSFLSYLPVILQTNVHSQVQCFDGNDAQIHCTFKLPEYNIFEKQWISDWPMTNDPGKPQLPQTGFFIQVPENDEIHIDITDSQQQYCHLTDVIPGPVAQNHNLSSEWIHKKDEHTYQADMDYPVSIFDISPPMQWRQTSMVRILIRPFQWNPVKQRLNIIQQMTFTVKLKTGQRFLVPSKNKKNKLSNMDQIKSNIISNYTAQSNTPKRCVQSKSKAFFTPKLNLKILKEGIYSLSYDDLRLHNFPISDYPTAHLQLWHQEKQIPLDIQSQSSYFQAGDQIRFYGQAIHSSYTDSTVYQLSWGSDEGLRMANLNASASHSTTNRAVGFQDLLLEMNDPKTLWTRTPNAPETDYVFWAQLTAPDSFSTSFDLKDLASVPIPAQMTITFQGKTESLHNASVYVNDHLVFQDQWENGTCFYARFTSDPSLLKPESNILRINTFLSGTVLVDVIYINKIHIQYPKNLVAQENTIDVGFKTFQENIEITGFTNNRIHLYDISEPCSPKKLIVQQPHFSNNVYSIRVFNQAAHRIYACSETAMQCPDIRLAYNERLKSTDFGADYIIITPEKFFPAVLPLAEHYIHKGLRVLSVSPEEIFDTFNGGIIHPQAINTFLKYAYDQWNRPQPTYVLMAGDSNLDYLNYFKTNKSNDAPVYLSFLPDMGISPDDNHYACTEGNDIIPDMIIGRIPGKTIWDITKIIQKSLSYRSEYYISRQANLFISDNDPLDLFANINKNAMHFFKNTMEQVHLQLPDKADSDTFTNQILSHLDQGMVITTYVGHGSIDNWTGEYVFATPDIQNIQANTPLSLYLSLNCLSGFFSLPDRYSLSESLILAENKGAIAVFAPTAMMQVWEVEILLRELFSTIQSSPYLSIGELVTAAKISAYGKGLRTDTLKMFTYMGDPGMHLNIHTRGIPGDANNDGDLSLADIILMMAIFNGEQHAIDLFSVDINGNQKLDILEVLFALMQLSDF
ncbi:MAG: hypothetical protein HQK75_10265 [Candidatus Magnetomorum sp.]|nr:hypothetical protein [Candidatus Magnetomorum sp.]